MSKTGKLWQVAATLPHDTNELKLVSEYDHKAGDKGRAKKNARFRSTDFQSGYWRRPYIRETVHSALNL